MTDDQIQEYFKRQNKTNRIKGYLLLAFFVLIGLIILMSNLNKSNYQSHVQTLQSSEDQLAAFLSKYGQPDKIVSTEYDNPRPLIVTQRLIYKKQKVVVTFFANSEVGAPPPYDVWKFMGFQDFKTNKVISAETAMIRFKK